MFRPWSLQGYFFCNINYTVINSYLKKGIADVISDYCNRARSCGCFNVGY